MNNLEVEQTPEQLQFKETPNMDNTAFTLTTTNMDNAAFSLTTPNMDNVAFSLTSSVFPEPEKVLQQPVFDTANRVDELGQVTVERAVSELDGSIDRTVSLIGQKRPLEDDSLLLHFEKSSTERVSSRQRVKKSNSDFLSDDHDVLASILGNLTVYSFRFVVSLL